MREHAFAHLQNWHVLTGLRLAVRWATLLVSAVLILAQQESLPLTDDLRAS